MLDCKAFHDALARRGVDFYTGVPDSLLKDFCAFVADHKGSENHLIAANEGAAVALAAGYHMATGKVPLVYLQNSGQGNLVNPLVSLTHPEVYGIPMLLLIGWRGQPGTEDEPQHRVQGRITQAMLDVLGIPHGVLPGDLAAAETMLDQALEESQRRGIPYAIVVPKKTFGAYQSSRKDPLAGSISREEAIEIISAAIPAGSAVVTTTGKASRELFEVRRRRGEDGDTDFLTVGAMGHASQIALGLAEGKSRLPVWCIDGDGAVIMHMGALALIGQRKPANLRHIVLNNGAHESVGGQPTAALGMDFPALARACGYRKAWLAPPGEDLADWVRKLAAEPGPCLLEVRVRIGGREDLGRPTHTPRQAKEAFMARVREA